VVRDGLDDNFTRVALKEECLVFGFWLLMHQVKDANKIEEEEVQVVSKSISSEKKAKATSQKRN